MVSTQNQGRNSSILPKAGELSSKTLLKCDPGEVAKQLTLVDFKYFKLIEPRELIDMNWTKEDKYNLSPNICKLAQWTSTASMWIVWEILSETDLDQRAHVLAHVIQVANVRFLINNP